MTFVTAEDRTPDAKLRHAKRRVKCRSLGIASKPKLFHAAMRSETESINDSLPSTATSNDVLFCAVNFSDVT